LLLDDYIIDTLMRDLCGHDRQPSAFLVYLFLYRQAIAGEVQVTLRDIAESTGLSKRSVQNAIIRLIKRRLISARRETITAVPIYTVLRPWKR
jgi:DNA-binding MarR family transcriptional regulator